jgi:RNA polymerase sigma factor (sigma-70 family)
MMAPDDSQLLERFVRERDESAFRELTERYAGMVLSVCRRVLGKVDDADDAAQATFLVLARHAARIDRSRPLAAWLHRVATNAARDLERSSRARVQREQETAKLRNSGTSSDDAMRDEIDACVAELPEMERAAIVLVYLQGLTPQESARHLGRSEGTVASWAVVCIGAASRSAH